MSNTGKLVYYANFNVTFGDEAEPMLSHFDDILMPALTSVDFQRGKDTDKNRFRFIDVHIKEFNDIYVLCGTIVMDTTLGRRWVSKGKDLLCDPTEMESSPYSRFLIFLDSHRMALVLNETDSPDMLSFRATVREILRQYTKAANAGKTREEKLPYASVNIVHMPLADDIATVLKSVSKINEVRWHFYPLNGDIDYGSLFKDVSDFRRTSGSLSADLTYNSPRSKETVAEAITVTKGRGLAKVWLKVIDATGPRTINDDEFIVRTKISSIGDVVASDDRKLFESAIERSELRKVDPENQKWYQSTLPSIKRWMNK